MFDKIRNIISGNKAAQESPEESPENHELKTRVAACVLFLEAAHIDNECTEEEMSHLMDSVKSRFDLEPAHAQELIGLAHSERNDAVDLWQFTNHMNQHYSKEEKIEILELVWQIIHIDGRLDKHEDHFVHKLANLLRLNHKELINAKLKGKEAIKS